MKEYMKKFFEKHETLISILWIVIYITINLYCIQNFGITDYRTTIINGILVLVITSFIATNKLGNYYGLTTLPKGKEFIYFLPLCLIVSVNFWNGININNTVTEIIFYMLSMICVGFIEEVIFRGFLFKMMEKDNANSAIIVSSLTFGIGHIINLLNGAEFIPTLMQICCAISLGYLFVIIFQKGKSLWPCIITHSAINASSIFNVSDTFIASIFLIIVSSFYAKFIKNNKKN